MGCIPEVGQTWEEEGLRLTIIEATDRRVVRVKLERFDDEEEEAAAKAS